MITEKIQKALNDQLNAELHSWYLYLAMASHFEHQNFFGFAKWMKIQAQEEMSHAMKIYEYLNQVNAKVILRQIASASKDWANTLAVFQDVYDHEIEITNSINKLVDLTITEKDHATNYFLIWFVNEQVEEVATAELILGKLKFIGENHNGIFFLDHELGKRT